MRVVGHHRLHLQARIVPRSAAAAAQVLARDVDRHVARGDSARRAAAAPCAASRRRTRRSRHAGPMCAAISRASSVRMRQLGARRVVLRQLADAVEQRRALRRRRRYLGEMLRGREAKARARSWREVAASGVSRPAVARIANRLEADQVRVSMKRVPREPQAGELPARGRREEVAIARPRMPGRRGEAAAAQHHLADHELAVVFGRPRRPAAGSRDRDRRRSASTATHARSSG